MTFVLNVDDVRLSEDMERGFKGGPGFDTTVLTGPTGIETRVINQTVSRGKWTAAFGMQIRSFWDPIMTLMLTQRGQGYGFKFKDYFDNTVSGQILGTGNGVITDFQIIKVFNSGVRTYTQNTYLPDPTSLVVTVNGVPSVAYTLQPGGIIRFTVAPASGSIAVTCGFFKAVRFAEDHQEMSFFMAANGLELAEIPAVTLIEVLPSST
jgi:uncharacterized protein (TIGR02217 family)